MLEDFLCLDRIEGYGERPVIMWKAFKNVETGTVHAVSLVSGMSPHGFAMDWPLVETAEPLTCHQCLQYAFRRQNAANELNALLPTEMVGHKEPERCCTLCGTPVSQCCC